MSVGSFLPPNGFVIVKYDVCVLASLYLLSITIPPFSLILTEVVISLSVVALILYSIAYTCFWYFWYFSEQQLSNSSLFLSHLQSKLLDKNNYDNMPNIFWANLQYLLERIPRSKSHFSNHLP